jgi:hypothetical protein
VYRTVPLFEEHTYNHSRCTGTLSSMTLSSILSRGLLISYRGGDLSHRKFSRYKMHLREQARYFPRWAMRNTMKKMHFNENLQRYIQCQYETRVERLGNKTVTKKTKANVTWNWSWRKRVISRVVSRVRVGSQCEVVFLCVWIVFKMLLIIGQPCFRNGMCGLPWFVCVCVCVCVCMGLGLGLGLGLG